MFTQTKAKEFPKDKDVDQEVTNNEDIGFECRLQTRVHYLYSLGPSEHLIAQPW